MSNLKLVVNNTDSLEHKIVENLKEHHGKAVNVFCALRNIDDFQSGFEALKSLIRTGLVEREEFGRNTNLFLYRYRMELSLLRRSA